MTNFLLNSDEFFQQLNICQSMPEILKPHLVDDVGEPLAPHLVRAVQSLLPRISKQFSRSLDYSEICSCVEEVARRAAVDEQRLGEQSRNPMAFLWTRVSNAMISLLRSKQRVLYWGEDNQTILLAESPEGTARAIFAAIQAREALDRLSSRDREICGYECLGYTTREIGELLGLSEDAIRKARSRRYQMLRKVRDERGKAKLQAVSRSV